MDDAADMKKMVHSLCNICRFLAVKLTEKIIENII